MTEAAISMPVLILCVCAMVLVIRIASVCEGIWFAESGEIMEAGLEAYDKKINVSLCKRVEKNVLSSERPLTDFSAENCRYLFCNTSLLFRMHFICFFKQFPVYNCRMMIFQANPFCFIIQNCFMARMHTATCFAPDSGSNINLIPDDCRYCRRAPVFLFDRVKPLELHLIPS